MQSGRGRVARALALVVAVFWLSLGSAAAAPVLLPGEGASAASSAWRVDVLHRINGVRRAVGVAPLRTCPALSAAAQGYALSMAETDRFAHVDAAGSGVRERLRAAGYRATATGENIAAGYTTPAAVMNGWITSPGHFANLTNPAFHHVGIGRAARDGTRYGIYWVLEFGSGGPC